MELTDAIRNKHFDTVLDSHLWKTSVEYTALATLRYCYGDKCKTLIKSESPDLQDMVNGLAIEVTDSVTEKNAKTIGEFVKLKSAKSERDREKSRKKIEQNGCQLVMDGIMFWPTIRPENEKSEIIDAYVQKLKKVAEYRNKGFEKVGLLIYHEKPIFRDTETEFSQWLVQAQVDHTDKFDFVYLFHNDGLIFYDFADETMVHTTISHEDREALGNLGRMMAEGEISDDDPIWR